MDERLALLRQWVGPEEQDQLTDDLALALLRGAGSAILTRLYPFDLTQTEVPARYHDLQVQIALEMWSKRGAEGQTYHAENGITRTWESPGPSSTLLRTIMPYVASVSPTPSETEGVP